jgi:hypothetical protein
MPLRNEPRPFWTFGRLNVSWLNTRASMPSSSALVQSSSTPNQWIFAAAGFGFDASYGSRYMHSMIDMSCRSS